MQVPGKDEVCAPRGRTPTCDSFSDTPPPPPGQLPSWSLAECLLILLTLKPHSHLGWLLEFLIMFYGDHLFFSTRTQRSPRKIHPTLLLECCFTSCPQPQSLRTQGSCDLHPKRSLGLTVIPAQGTSRRPNRLWITAGSTLFVQQYLEGPTEEDGKA